MKNILVLTLVAVLMFAVPVLAETEATILDESAGITPDSPFYGLDKAMDKLSLRMTFNEQKRVQKALRIAEERLAEVNEMADEGTQEDLEAAEEAHEEVIEIAEEAMDNVDMDGSVEESEEALETITELEAQIQTHSEKVAAVKQGILERKRTQNMSAEQLGHLEQVFAKIMNKAQEMENKVAAKKENAKTSYKIQSGKTDAEVNKFAEQVREEVQSRQRIDRSDEGVQEETQAMKGQDDSEEDELEAETEESGAQGQASQQGNSN